MRMKKSLHILILTVFVVVSLEQQALISQNLVINGDLELWDDLNTPANWEVFEGIASDGVTLHGGAFAAKHTSSESTQKLRQDISGIQEGQNYTIRYYYYDNDPMARTRIWSYWLYGETYLDANAVELRPSVYSTDSDAWVEYSVTLTAPPTADGFRFDVRVYKENSLSGGSVFYDDFSVEPEGVHPEPTNYPANFNAVAENLSVNLTWDDATGDQPPAGYLVMGNLSGQFSAPVDGITVDNDTDLSDGSGVLNIAYGLEECAFSGLIPGTLYHFTIYPYSNGGVNIDYKTDGTAPATQASISNILVLNHEDFNDTTLGNWTQYSVVGPDQYWYAQDKFGIDNSPNAKMSGYSGGAIENEDWLISPALDGAQKTNETLVFYSATNYPGPAMEVKISADYSGSGDPNNATWTGIDAVLSSGTWEWTYSGDINIAAYAGDHTFYIAFVFFSNNSESATWEVDDILITAEESTGLREKGTEIDFSVFPNPGLGLVKLSGQYPTNTMLNVHSVTGKIIEKVLVPENGIIDLTHLNSGLYLISLVSGGEIIATSKLMIR